MQKKSLDDPGADLRPRNEQKTGEQDEILRSLRQIMRAVDLHSRRLVESCGLTGPQLVCLNEIARCELISPTELARSVHLSNATITGILGRLESRGLIRRQRALSDRRRVDVMLSEAGRDLISAAPSPLQDRLAARLATLRDWERLQILATLRRVAEMMDAEDIDASAILVTGAIEPNPKSTKPQSETRPEKTNR